MTKEELLKVIVKLPYPARIESVCAGNVYYQIHAGDIIYQFCIDTTDKDDAGTTSFLAEYKPITLMRYIRKAIEKDELIMFKKNIG